VGRAPAVKITAQAHTLSRATAAWCAAWRSAPHGRLASGGNDGQLNVWDLRRPSEPTVAFEQHRAAAVKAIAWHPDVRNVLASGGGSADRYLRLWDVDARRCFNRRDTRSQVTGLLWSTQHNELISSHGYSEEAALALWTTPDLHRVAQLHSINRRERALYMVGSNCGRFIAIADTVRTLSFYSVFISDVDHALQDDENSDSNAALISATALASAPPVVRAAASTTSREHKRSGGAQRVSKRGRMSSWTIR
jgi:WD40 repeat protein